MVPCMPLGATAFVILGFTVLEAECALHFKELIFLDDEAASSDMAENLCLLVEWVDVEWADVDDVGCLARAWGLSALLSTDI